MRELALLKQMPWARGADGVEGPDSALPQKLDHSLRADRRLERKERELPRAFAWASVHAVFSVGKVVCAFCELPCQHVGVRDILCQALMVLVGFVRLEIGNPTGNLAEIDGLSLTQSATRRAERLRSITSACIRVTS